MYGILGEVETFTKENSPICMCDVPIKEYSKTTCTCCWWCKKCGKYGGCDNMYWMTEEQINEKLKNERYIKEKLEDERHKGII